MGEMAKKISNIDNEELLKVLNEAFAEEWLAYYQYWIGAQVIEGPMRTSIQGEFMKHAKEELEHAEWLAVRIIQLGGTPILNPADWEKTHDKAPVAQRNHGVLQISCPRRSV